MNELSKERTMTVQETATALNCSDDTVLRAANELFPNKVENGKRTYLNEVEVTAIKLKIQTHHNLRSTAELPETELEMLLLDKKVNAWKDRKLEELKLRVEKAETTNAILMHTKKTYTATELAKELNMRSAQALNNKLAEMGIQYFINGTWVFSAKYADLGLESIKQDIINGESRFNRHFTQDGRLFILKLFDKIGK